MNKTRTLIADLRTYVDEITYSLEDTGELETARSQALNMIAALEKMVEDIDNGTLEDPTDAAWVRKAG